VQWIADPTGKCLKWTSAEGFTMQSAAGTKDLTYINYGYSLQRWKCLP